MANILIIDEKQPRLPMRRLFQKTWGQSVFRAGTAALRQLKFRTPETEALNKTSKAIDPARKDRRADPPDPA